MDLIETRDLQRTHGHHWLKFCVLRPSDRLKIENKAVSFGIGFNKQTMLAVKYYWESWKYLIFSSVQNLAN